MKVGEKARYFGTVDDDSMTGRIFTDKEEQVQLSLRNGAWSFHMDSLNDDLFADGSEAEQ
jgi:hypothetical protein